MDHAWATFIGVAVPLMHWAGEQLTSWWAWRIYAGFGGLATVAASLWYASRLGKEVLEISKLKGALPKLSDSIEKSLKDIASIKRREAARGMRVIGLIVVFGFVMPSIVLISGIYFYSWFSPTDTPLVLSEGCKTFAFQPSPIQTIEFVGSQFFMGFTEARLTGSLLNGVLRKMPMGDYVPGNMTVGLLVIGFRYFIGIFGTIVAGLTWRCLEILYRKTEQEVVLEDRRKALLPVSYNILTLSEH